MEEKNYTKGIFFVLLVFLLVLTVTILKITYTVSVPIALAIFMSLCVLPIITRVHKKTHMPWGVGIFLSLVFFVILISVIGSLLAKSAQSVLAMFPKYEERMLYVYQYIAERFALPYDEGKTLIQNLWGQLGIRNAIQGFALTISNYAVSFLKNLLTILLLYTFLLTEVSITQGKVNLAFQGKMKYRVNFIIIKVIVETTRFLSIKFFVSLATGLIVFGGLSLLKIDFPIIWGFLAFVLNFIPTFGSWISCTATILFSILQCFPSWPPMLYVALLMIGTNFVIGNIIEPKIEGDNLDLSPFIILVSLSIWGWIWGFIGMILAVPMTVIIKIISENISFLNPIAIFLGGNKVKQKSDA